LFGGELLGIDGSKLAALNSRENNFNDKKLQERLTQIDAQIQDYLKALEETDARESQNPEPLSREQLAAKIAQLQERKEEYEGWEVELEASEEKQLSLSDPDARRMHTAQGNVVGYNAQLAVDAKHKLIAAQDVTNAATDVRQLANVALEAKENLGLPQSEVVADTGYYNAAEVSRCVEAGLTPFIPKADTSANTARGLFGKSRFSYDETKDVYVCPAGQELTYRFEPYELGRAIRYYRARHCRACPLRSQCTRNQGNRTITREENESLMEAMAERVKAQPEKMRLRKQLCEHPFGTIKRALGYDHFLLKGLEKVRAEWSLITLVYNLKRVLKLLSFEKLMAAVS
jgi:hypothetical protein